MLTYRGIYISEENEHIKSQGLEGYLGKEFRILLKSKTNQEYSRVMAYLIDYVLDNRPIISSGETIAYYSWLLQMCQESVAYFDIWEACQDGSGFTQGVDFSLNIITEQIDECKKRGVLPLFPTYGQKIVISEGVLEGLGVDAVRYRSPEHMTGWWVTTDQYDDDVNSLIHVYYFHVVFKRPDLLKYFALPFGYRFYINENEEDIWFDEDAVIE